MNIKLIASDPVAELKVYSAARGCYSNEDSYSTFQYNLFSDKDKIGKFIRGIVLSGHESVLEHAVFTFSIEGISRSCSHQLVRHRIASFSQQSQRYVEFDGDCELDNLFVVPPSIQAQPSLKGKFISACLDTLEVYDELRRALVDSGSTSEQAQEDARFILPNGAKTNITLTMNARELRHFFNQRMCKRSQWEIRELANKMHDILVPLYPNLFFKCGPNCVIDKCKEGKHSCGQPFQNQIS